MPHSAVKCAMAPNISSSFPIPFYITCIAAKLFLSPHPTIHKHFYYCYFLNSANIIRLIRLHHLNSFKLYKKNTILYYCYLINYTTNSKKKLTEHSVHYRPTLLWVLNTAGIQGHIENQNMSKDTTTLVPLLLEEKVSKFM